MAMYNTAHEMAERLKAREDYFRLLSHELRTPLNGVLGMLQLLERTTLSPDQKDYVTTALQSGQHLLGLVNDFLDFARIDAGKIALEANRVYLEPLLQSVAELLAPRAALNNIEIVWRLDPRLDYVITDEGRLRQILFNLAGNALKFTHKGGVSLEVALNPSGEVIFHVRDTGEGIPLEAQERIFEAFGQVDPSHASKYGGAGLGLVVVKKLVEAMNGTLTLKSDVGQGTVFSAAFGFAFGCKPLADSAPLAATVALMINNSVLRDNTEAHLLACHFKTEAETEADFLLVDRDAQTDIAPPLHKKAYILLTPEQRDEIEAWRKAGWAGYFIKPLRRESLRRQLIIQPQEQQAIAVSDERAEDRGGLDKLILLVEDNPVNALLAEALLRREGCRVERVSTGEDAILRLEAQRYDLVLMDLGLPGQDGLSTTRAVRRFDTLTPIWALTANAYEEDRRACLAAGMNDFLTKPINPVALKSALNGLFGMNAQRVA